MEFGIEKYAIVEIKQGKVMRERIFGSQIPTKLLVHSKQMNSINILGWEKNMM